jgi:hypothetical protein
MTLAFDALQKKTIQEVLEWYEFQVEVLGREKERVIAELLTSVVPADSRFFGMSRAEIDDFFDVHRSELDFVVILDLMSAAEAAIRLDYLDRVGKRRKDPVSKHFREIYRKLSRKKSADKVSLEEHILDTWTTHDAETRVPISDFKGALKLRHWLAHGRYWHPKIGKQYSPRDVYDISSNLLRAIDA